MNKKKKSYGYYLASFFCAFAFADYIMGTIIGYLNMINHYGASVSFMTMSLMIHGSLNTIVCLLIVLIKQNIKRCDNWQKKKNVVIAENQKKNAAVDLMKK